MSENYKVKQGDCISSVAFEKGFFPATIWDHPNNKELKDKRKDPNVLLPGDSLFVPDKRINEVSKPTNEVHKFRIKNTPKLLRVQFIDLETPVANMDFEFEIDGVLKTGKTDNEGWINEYIDPSARKGQLTFADGSKFELLLGNLDPVDEISGIQGRLWRLGLFEGKIDGKLTDETKAAIALFQTSCDLEATGEPDQSTKDELVKMAAE